MHVCNYVCDINFACIQLLMLLLLLILLFFKYLLLLLFLGPLMPESVSWFLLGPTDVQLTWARPARINGRLASYEVSCCEDIPPTSDERCFTQVQNGNAAVYSQLYFFKRLSLHQMLHQKFTIVIFVHNLETKYFNVYMFV